MTAAARRQEGSGMTRTDEFQELRPLLFSIAYRILGSVSEAEDAVQEAWLRYELTPAKPVSPKAFLSATVTRLSIDVLRSALLPLPLPEVRGVSMASVFIPAHQRALVGGDFYDVHPRTDGSATFALGDVCGHGLEAAVHSGRVRQSLQALSLVETNPVRLLHLLNTSLRATGSKLFTTIVVGELVPLTGGGARLSLASGGHPAPLILRADGTVQDVSAPGAIVGILSDVRFHGEQVTLAPGDGAIAALAGGEIADRRVDQHHRQPAGGARRGKVGGGRIVGELHLDRVEAGIAGGGEAFRQWQFGEQPGQVGGETQHRLRRRSRSA